MFRSERLCAAGSAIGIRPSFRAAAPAPRRKHRNEGEQTRSIDLATPPGAAAVAHQRGSGMSASVALAISHYMPTMHGTHVDFIAPWARALESRSRGAIAATVFDG